MHRLSEGHLPADKRQQAVPWKQTAEAGAGGKYTADNLRKRYAASCQNGSLAGKQPVWTGFPKTLPDGAGAVPSNFMLAGKLGNGREKEKLNNLLKIYRGLDRGMIQF